MKLECWKCGQRVSDLPKPLGRREECPACHADLHCCRQCTFYDTSAPKHCRETVADEVREKERANFCGYFTLHPNAYTATDNRAADAARTQLDALFGDDGSGAAPSQAAGNAALSAADKARQELESLFGLDEGKPQK
jgi:hypothetical protein